eukprot:16681-Heterococcus_DN1.PRE.1
MYEPVHIVLLGLPGAGKSTLGNNLLGSESFTVSNIDQDGTHAVNVQSKPGMVVYDTPGLSSNESGWIVNLHSELSNRNARKVVILLVMDACVRRLSSWIPQEVCYVIHRLLYAPVTFVVFWSFAGETSKANLTVKKQQLDSALHRIIPASIIEHKTLKTLLTMTSVNWENMQTGLQQVYVERTEAIAASQSINERRTHSLPELTVPVIEPMMPFTMNICTEMLLTHKDIDKAFFNQVLTEMRAVTSLIQTTRKGSFRHHKTAGDAMIYAHVTNYLMHMIETTDMECALSETRQFYTGNKDSEPMACIFDEYVDKARSDELLSGHGKADTIEAMLSWTRTATLSADTQQRKKLHALHLAIVLAIIKRGDIARVSSSSSDSGPIVEA